MKIKARIIGLLFALAAMLGGGLLAAPPASADAECSVIAGITYCGKIRNHAQSNAPLTVTGNWDCPTCSMQSLQPGRQSTFRDTDGFLARTGCRTTSRTGSVYTAGKWHKIVDTTDAEIQVRC